MGQFYSREFDGDPYIDLMRTLPERELVWWAQKVIWLAEGFTFVDHFARTYPRLFQHKCERCKGAGVLTCPACAGTNVALGLTSANRRPALAGVAGAVEHASASGRGAFSRLPGGGLALPGSDLLSPQHSHSHGEGGADCRLCGGACAWDAESEWADKWGEWESRLAYYDKAAGPLMDEWYEDVINAGNLEEDTQAPEEEPPGPDVPGRWAEEERLLSKDKKRMAALMKRFGHPYDADATLGYQIVDPTASMGENIWNMAQVYNSTPPELNPLRTAHLAGRAGEGELDPAAANAAALEAFDGEVVMEAAIMQNLEAAAQDLPKPHRFLATAGTIPCNVCAGGAWYYSPFPNTQVLFRTERPFWGETLARLNKYWNPTHLSDPSRTGQLLPYGEHGLRSLLAEAGGRDLMEEVAGAAPESTGRYRRELQLLLDNPELRDARLTAPGGLGERGLAALLQQQGRQDGAGGEGGRDLAASSTPLELYATAAASGGRA